MSQALWHAAHERLSPSTYFRQVDVDIEGPILPTLDELRFLYCLERKQHHSVAGTHLSFKTNSLYESESILFVWIGESILFVWIGVTSLSFSSLVNLLMFSRVAT